MFTIYVSEGTKCSARKFVMLQTWIAGYEEDSNRLKGEIDKLSKWVRMWHMDI